MLKIKLSRIGKTNAPSYRIVVAEAKSKLVSKSIDILGWYNPSEKTNKFEYNEKTYKEWVKKGAKPTLAVESVIRGNYKYVKYEPKKKKEEQAAVENQKTTEPEVKKES